jgi:hypothetical protein
MKQKIRFVHWCFASAMLVSAGAAWTFLPGAIAIADTSSGDPSSNTEVAIIGTPGCPATQTPVVMSTPFDPGIAVAKADLSDQFAAAGVQLPAW